MVAALIGKRKLPACSLNRHTGTISRYGSGFIVLRILKVKTLGLSRALVASVGGKLHRSGPVCSGQSLQAQRNLVLQ
jgi:hypothetical protein